MLHILLKKIRSLLNLSTPWTKIFVVWFILPCFPRIILPCSLRFTLPVCLSRIDLIFSHSVFRTGTLVGSKFYRVICSFSVHGHSCRCIRFCTSKLVDPILCRPLFQFSAWPVASFLCCSRTDRFVLSQHSQMNWPSNSLDDYCLHFGFRSETDQICCVC